MKEKPREVDLGWLRNGDPFGRQNLTPLPPGMAFTAEMQGPGWPPEVL